MNRRATTGLTRGQWSKAYPFDINPYDTAKMFKKRHRIRLDISSSNFPRFDVNPNTGEALGLNRRTVTAENTVYFDAQHPSALKLWISTSAPTSDRR